MNLIARPQRLLLLTSVLLSACGGAGESATSSSSSTSQEAGSTNPESEAPDGGTDGGTAGTGPSDASDDATASSSESEEGDASDETGAQDGSVGPEGGTVHGADGARVVIPPGALDEEVNIEISVVEGAKGELPALAVGKIYALTPHGLQFNSPVTIHIPHESTPEHGVALFTSPEQGDWEKIGVAEVSENETVATVVHFSFFYNGREVCGLALQECCDGTCAGANLECTSNVCVPCGINASPCCGEESCLGDLECGPDLYCAPPSSGGFIP